MSALVVRGDARALPLPDASVDLIVTSPPYFALRSYTDNGQHYEGQIGSEPTPQEYIVNLMECTREWMRVLKPTGSCWVGLGDKYGRPGGGADRNPRSLPGAGAGTTGRMRTPTDGGGRDKCLMLLPERYRVACVDQLGLIARAVVVWNKPNPIPESVVDRVKRSHEDWVHLTKQSRYYSAVDEIREDIAHSTRQRWGRDLSRRDVTGGKRRGVETSSIPGEFTMGCNPLGKLPGSVWTIATEPLTVPDHLGVDHFAAFPTEWPRRIILGWSPSGICTACDEGRWPSVERAPQGENKHPDALTRRRSTLVGGQVLWRKRMQNPDVITGEACACPDTTAPTRPSVILDPFGGTGTTALVAHGLGRTGITVDRSMDYCRLAQWRTSDRGELAKAMRVPKPPVEVTGQGDLFELGGVS